MPVYTKTAILFEDDFNALRKFMEERKPFGKGALIMDPDRTRANILENFPHIERKILTDGFLASLFTGTYTILEQRGGEVEISYPSNCLDPDETNNMSDNEKIYRKVKSDLAVFSFVIGQPFYHGPSPTPDLFSQAIRTRLVLEQIKFNWRLLIDYPGIMNNFMIMGKCDSHHIAKLSIEIQWDEMKNDTPTLVINATYRNKLPSHYSHMVSKFPLVENSDFLTIIRDFTSERFLLNEEILMSDSPAGEDNSIRERITTDMVSVGIKLLRCFENEISKDLPDNSLVKDMLHEMGRLVPILNSTLIGEELHQTLLKYGFFQTFGDFPNFTRLNPNNIVPGVRSPYPPSEFGFPPNGDFRIPVIADPNARAFMAMKQSCMRGTPPTENDYMGPAGPIRM